MTLPIDRTTLTAAAVNQVPNAIIRSAQNIAAITAAFNGVDEVYNFATGLISASTLSRLGIINVRDYNASGLATTAIGSITTGTKILTLTTTPDFLAGHGINLQGAIEASSLQVTATATVSSNVTVTLNGVAFLVAVLAGDTAIQVATKIRAATFTGWTAGGTAGTDTVTFTSTSSGVKTDNTYSAGTTTATGTMTTTTQGTADQISTVSSIAGLVVNIADNSTRTITAGTLSHDDSSAIRTAIRASINASSINGNIELRFPPGSFLISDNGVFSDITQTNRGGIHFVGAGRMATVLQLVTGGTAKWFYDNSTNARFQFCTFSHMQFTADSTTYGNGFRPYSTGHEQGFHFYDCWFFNLSTGFRFDGTLGNSEYKFFGCKFYGITSRCFDLNNPQSVNMELFGTECENINGDVFYISAGGGGSIKVFGGSFILIPSGKDGYILNINSGGNTGTGNQDFNFYSIKTELNTVTARLVNDDRGNVGLSTTNFIGCNLTSTLGGNREAVVIDGNKRLIFDKCIMGDFSYRLKGSNEAYPFASSLEFINSNVPSNIADNITLVTNYGSASAHGCVSNGTSQPTKAINFDRNWENRGTMDREIPLKTITIKPYSLPYPYASGTEYTIILPKFATIKGIHIKKPAAGVTTSTYQLFVGSDDKVTIYGQSTLGAQNLDHIINAVNLFVYTGSTKQTIRLWATGGDSIQNGGYAIVEYY